MAIIAPSTYASSPKVVLALLTPPTDILQPLAPKVHLNYVNKVLSSSSLKAHFFFTRPSNWFIGELQFYIYKKNNLITATKLVTSEFLKVISKETKKRKRIKGVK